MDKLSVYQCAWTQAEPFRIVGVGPVEYVFNKAVFDGIGVDVAAKVYEIAVVGDDFDFVWPFKDGAGVGVFFVVGFAVTVEKALDEDVGLDTAVLPRQYVVMVGQQTVSDDGDIEFFYILLEMAQ